MVKRCKIGDRAFIIKSQFPENIGRIVRILSDGYHCDWLTISEGAPLKTQDVDLNRNTLGFSFQMECECSDNCLMPIRGEPEKESEKEKEVA